MRSYRTWWLIFAVCTTVVVAAMAWVTAGMVRLERAEQVARAEAGHQEALRLALWRADSWFAPHLAREAARPYFDYRPFHAQQRAYTRLLHEIEPGEVLTPSPLLGFEPAYIRLHFQIEPDGSISSPQAPTGNLRDLAEGSYLAPERIAASEGLLTMVRSMIQPEQVFECVMTAEPGVTLAAMPPASVRAPAPEGQEDQRQVQEARGQVEWTKRAQSYARNTIDQAQIAQQLAPLDQAAAVAVGPFVPFWSGTEGDELFFVRRVNVTGAEYLQGFMCDWPRLRDALRAEIVDLFALADLVPVAIGSPGAAGARSSETLAAAPVRLVVPPSAPAVAAALSRPTRTTLGLAWLAVVTGLVAVAITLRASIAFGEKRSRFASAVTHEMRTPLTTFRMYSEMLAEDMVRPEQRATYLATLRTESDRLARLVENVLAYARLERTGRRAGRSRATVERQALSVAELVERVQPPLERIAGQADMTLVVEADAGEAVVSVDVETLAQIVSNLVDNACKYANGSADRTIHLAFRRAVRPAGDELVVEVRDHGPGVRTEAVRSIFAPFDRGGRGPDDGVPGVGLGLALSRDLARSLGGDLRLLPANGEPREGACFRLTLPSSKARTLPRYG